MCVEDFDESFQGVLKELDGEGREAAVMCAVEKSRETVHAVLDLSWISSLPQPLALPPRMMKGRLSTW